MLGTVLGCTWKIFPDLAGHPDFICSRDNFSWEFLDFLHVAGFSGDKQDLNFMKIFILKGIKSKQKLKYVKIHEICA